MLLSLRISIFMSKNFIFRPTRTVAMGNIVVSLTCTEYLYSSFIMHFNMEEMVQYYLPYSQQLICKFLNLVHFSI
jgi:hypothetical protein